MGRDRVHKSNNDRLKAHRFKRKINSSEKFFCDVCNDYVQFSKGSSEKEALLLHRRNSKKHRNLVRKDFPYWVPHEDEDDNVDEMEADEMVIDDLDDERIDCTASTVTFRHFAKYYLDILESWILGRSAVKKTKTHEQKQQNFTSGRLRPWRVSR